jgi:hypothetical protein
MPIFNKFRLNEKRYGLLNQFRMANECIVNHNDPRTKKAMSIHTLEASNYIDDYLKWKDAIHKESQETAKHIQALNDADRLKAIQQEEKAKVKIKAITRLKSILAIRKKRVAEEYRNKLVIRQLTFSLSFN